jgi:putative ABC transport system ATP-binding protein
MGVRGAVERAAGTARISEPFIALAGVEKTYRMGRLDYPALRGIDLEIGTGELVAVVGPSGSGKTTILNLVAGIDRPTAGAVTVGGQRIDTMSEEALAVWRDKHVGVVFQFLHSSSPSCRSGALPTSGAALRIADPNARMRAPVPVSDWQPRQRHIDVSLSKKRHFYWLQPHSHWPRGG